MKRRGSGYSLFSPGDEVRLLLPKGSAPSSVSATVVHAGVDGISLVTATRELCWVRNSELSTRLRFLSAVGAERKSA